jgi:hypothetical protein
MHQIKPELRRQDLEGIHLPLFRFSWKLKKLCRVDFFVFESWQTAVKLVKDFDKLSSFSSKFSNEFGCG